MHSCVCTCILAYNRIGISLCSMYNKKHQTYGHGDLGPGLRSISVVCHDSLFVVSMKMHNFLWIICDISWIWSCCMHAEQYIWTCKYLQRLIFDYFGVKPNIFFWTLETHFRRCRGLGRKDVIFKPRMFVCDNLKDRFEKLGFPNSRSWFSTISKFGQKSLDFRAPEIHMLVYHIFYK